MSFLCSNNAVFREVPAGICRNIPTIRGNLFYIATAVLSLFSLFRKRSTRGPGVFALILSPACFTILRLSVTGLLASAAETEKKAAVVAVAPFSSAAALAKAEEKAAEKPLGTEPADAESPISFQVENLYHLDSRGLPSKGVTENPVFLTGAK